ncbi:MAG: GNAT family N-acetyltransferase [Planctomycetaceae bacterium]|jgi:RimJ/RimL family protein N-acetyltransferase|nr:GNAT family N-acetyltransferase [Planctomycetaceae bacterium]
MLITHPNPSLVQDSIKLAFRHLSREEFPARQQLILNLINSGMIETDGFFIGIDNNTIVGVLISQLRPDGLIMIWHPVTSDNRSIQPFFKPLDDYAQSHKVPAIIMIVDKNQEIDEKTIFANGFTYISDMLMLVSNVSAADEQLADNLQQNNLLSYKPKKPELNNKDSRLQFIPLPDITKINENQNKIENNNTNYREQLINVMSATYINTKDFPKLLVLTQIEQILDEYQKNTFFRPELWFFVRKLSDSNGTDKKSDTNCDKNIGVLLLTDSPPDQIDLTYMGLIESERGQGYSQEIIKFAKQTAINCGRKLVTTSVDEQNTAALKSYINYGFAAWDRKKIYTKIFNNH